MAVAPGVSGGGNVAPWGGGNGRTPWRGSGNQRGSSNAGPGGSRGGGNVRNPPPPVPWQPPLPAPLPPAPIIPPGGFLPIIGGALLGQLWGWLSGRLFPVRPPDEDQNSWGQASSVGQSRYRQVLQIFQSFGGLPPNCVLNPASVNNTVGNWSAWGSYKRIYWEVTGGAGVCGGIQNYGLRLELTDGTVVNQGVAGSFQGITRLNTQWEWEFRNGAVRDPRAPQLVPPPALPLPLPWGDEPQPLRPRREGDPEAPVLPAPWAPELPPIPKAPPAAPSIPPDTQPLPPGDPAPGGNPEPGRGRPALPALPGRQPSAPPDTRPEPVGPQPGNDGEVGPGPGPGRDPVAPPGPPQTDPDVITVGGEQIGQPGFRPPPTLVGIASELGRLEQKMERMIRDQSEPLDLSGIIDALTELLRKDPEPHDAGSYELYPVCDFGEDGSPRPPDVAAWPSGEGEIALVNKKLDALALLIQYHKEQRQPTCKRGATIGQPVSVLFDQVV